MKYNVRAGPMLSELQRLDDQERKEKEKKMKSFPLCKDLIYQAKLCPFSIFTRRYQN